MKTRNKINLIAIILTCMSFAIQTNAAVIYNSTDNASSNWMDISTWNVNQVWANASPGSTVNGATNTVNIYGKVTFKDLGSNLKINGSAEVIVYDTLIIETAIEGDGGGGLTVAPGGVLIILQASNLAGSFQFVNNGNTVLVDDLSMKGGSDLYNNTDFFTFTTITKTGGAAIHGLTPPYPDAAVLESSNNSLFNLVSSSISVALPIKLLYIESKCGQDDKVNIEWATASESNNDFFTLWRSTDGINWEIAGKVSGAGTSSVVNTYTFIDEKPTEHDTYYKISQTDYDGKTEEFDILSIYCLYNHKHITFTPIPAIDYVELSFYNEHHTIANLYISIFDKQGKIVTKQIFESKADDNNHIINLPSNMLAGNYFIQVKFGDEYFHSTTFIKTTPN